MANIGTLTAHIGADTRGLQTGLSRAEAQLNGFSRSTTAMLGRVGAAFASAFAASKIAGVVKNVTMVAARVEELGVVLENTGRASNYSAQYLAQEEQKIEALGITTEASRTLLIRLMQSQLDVADAAKIVRAAQDLAVIAQMDSSQATETLTYAIAAQQPILLKQFGIVTDLTEIYGSYAKTIGKSAQDLTDVEKRQATMNVVMEQAARVAGTYEAAMETAGKQYRSLNRYTQEAAVAVGNHFLPALSLAVHATENFMKAVTALASPLQTSIASIMKQRGVFDESEGSINAVIARYEELKNETARTADEQNEYNRIMKKILSIMPSVIVEYDRYGNMLRLNEESLRKNLSAERALLQIETDKKIAEITAKVEDLNVGLEKQTKYYEKIQGTSEVFEPYYGFTMLYSDKLKELTGQQAVFLPILELSGRFFEIYGDRVEMARQRVEGLKKEQGKLQEYLDQLKGVPPPMMHGPTMEELKGPPPPPIDTQKLLDAQVNLLDNLLNQTGKSRDELLAVWDQYEMARLKQLEAEAAGLLKLGVSADLVKDSLAVEVQKLEQKKIEKLTVQYEAIPGPPPVSLEEWWNLDKTQQDLQRALDEMQTRTENYYTWLKETGRISTEDYIARLQEKLAGEQEFSDAWMQIYQQISSIEAAEAEAAKQRWIENHEIKIGIYKSIGEAAANTFSNMAANGQNLFDALENAAEAFKNAVISVLAQWLAKAIATGLIDLARHTAIEKAKTAVTAQEAAKRAAIESASGIPGIGIFGLFFKGGGLVGMQGGGLLHGGTPGRDSVPIIGEPGEYMLDVPTVKAVGIPALEYMRKEHRIPSREQTIINVNMGGFSFGQMSRAERLTLPLDFEDAVKRALENLVRTGKLEI